MKKALLIICMFLASIPLMSQNVSTEGNDFWIGFMENRGLEGDVEPTLKVFISAVDSTGGSISNPATGWSRTFSVDANSSTEITIAPEQGLATGNGSIQAKGLHLVTDLKVSVFALNFKQFSADAAVILPTFSLGKSYYAIAHMEKDRGASNPTGAVSMPSEVLVLGITEQTEIEITPSSSTLAGQPLGVPFTITLNRGETYQIKSNEDLTGTKLESVNSNLGDCKNFAVFAGCEWTNLGQCGGYNDQLYEQMFPTNTWGSNFTTVPYKTRRGGDFFKVIASEDGTSIQMGIYGNYNLNAGEFLELTMVGPQSISSNRPIQMAQFSRSTECDGVEGDPFMIMLSPNEQMLREITFNAFRVVQIENYYLNIVTKTDAIDLITLDESSIAGSFIPVGGNTNYSYAQVDINRGNHTIASDSGFIAYVYGYGMFESFGYATGLSLSNLNVEIVSKDESLPNIPNSDTLCINSDVAFTVEADTSFVIFEWDFGDGSTATGDSVSHAYSEPGEYIVNLTLATGQGDCANQEKARKVIQVVNPSVDILGPRSVCPFTNDVDYTLENRGGVFFNWLIKGGTLTSGQGTLNATIDWGDSDDAAYVKVVPRNQLGCWGDTVTLNVTINIQLKPEAPSGLDSLCSYDINEIPYTVTFPSGTSSYEWFSENGTFSNGNTQEEVGLNFIGAGTAKIWFLEQSLLNNICEGTSDTLLVNVLNPVESDPILSDVLCNGEATGAIELNPIGGKGGPYIIEWSNGFAGENPTNLIAGQYEVLITDSLGCFGNETLIIDQPSTALSITATPSSVTCYGERNGSGVAIAVGGTPGYRYQWAHPNGSGNQIFDVGAGTYNVTAFDNNNCAVALSLEITQPDSLYAEMTVEDVYCLGNPTGIAEISHFGGVGPFEYKWDPTGSTDNRIENVFAGIYTASVTDQNGCIVNVTDEISEFLPKVYAPTAFTPNGDGFNDNFKPIYQCEGDTELLIYNRWGQLVFASNNPEEGWDGTFEGEIKNGTYAYKIKFTYITLQGEEFIRNLSGKIVVLK